MKVIITMAGKGQRFRDAGHNCPKYMIEVLGKTLFEWSMLSLSDFFDSEFIFITRSTDEPDAFIEQYCNKLGINNFKVIALHSYTDGQATTVLAAAEFLGGDDSLAIYNIDTFIEPGCILYNQLNGDGFIPGFIAEGSKWSFIRMDNKGRVTDIAEKNPISNIATLGFYYFSSFSLYKAYYESTFNEGKNLVNGEKYIAAVYKTMLEDDLEVFGSIIPVEHVWGLGTPEDVLIFLNSYAKG